MHKIPTLYTRDFHHNNGRYVTDELTPGCEWVLAGEGIPTRKYDGTCVMRDQDGRWWARREVKRGKPLPAEFMTVSTDETTGKTVGWEPAINSSFWKYLREALDSADPSTLDEGTYELCGPKINGNPEGYDHHTLIRHADAEKATPEKYQAVLPGADLTITPKDLVRQARMLGWEGIVWHHPDGRMAKLKVRDLQDQD